jgi:NifU-like protein involved in Fe-S cluster formation
VSADAMQFEPYNTRVREYFAETRHAGKVPDGVTVAIDEQGVSVEMSASVTGGTIEALRFRIRGCPHSIAVCEAICRELEGAKVERLEDFSVQGLMQSLAVPAAKSGRILLFEDIARQLGTALQQAESSTEQH